MVKDIFLTKTPHLDLHGETLATVDYVVNSFLSDNVLMKNNCIVIIHGWNKTVLKNRVKELLRKQKKVKEFYIDPENIGQTIVILDI